MYVEFSLFSLSRVVFVYLNDYDVYSGGIESGLKVGEGQAVEITEETVFQVEGRAGAKALGWDHAW